MQDDSQEAYFIHGAFQKLGLILFQEGRPSTLVINVLAKYTKRN